MEALRRGTVRLSAILGLSLALLLLGRAEPARAGAEQDALVEQARATVVSLLQDPNFPTVADTLRRARAVLIVPSLIKGGFIIGAEGGTGVLLVRRADGSWSYPSFYTMVGGSIGLQIGGQVSEVVLAIMTDAGVQAIRDRKVTLGADADAALITVGAGIGARTGLDPDTDMYAFARNQGLFAGGALEGSVIQEEPRWNEAYYGPGATTTTILQGSFVNPQADALRATLPR